MDSEGVICADGIHYCSYDVFETAFGIRCDYRVHYGNCNVYTCVWGELSGKWKTGIREAKPVSGNIVLAEKP